jgi:hypothetical protein
MGSYLYIKKERYGNAQYLFLSLMFGLWSFSAEAGIFEGSWFSGVTLQHQLSVPSTLEYDTNPSLVANSPSSIWRFSVTPKYTLNAYDGRNIWTLGAALNVQRSSDKLISQDREDPSINAAWMRDYELGSYGINAAYSQSSSRVSELKSTGLVFNDGTSLNQSIGGNYSRSFSDKLIFSITGAYSEQNFSGQSAGLVNYTNQSLSPRITYISNEKLSTYLQGSYGHYKPSIGVTSDLISAVIGAMYKPSEKLDLNINGGLNQQTSGTTSATNFQGGLIASYAASERKTYTATYARSTSASGLGSYIQSDSISLGAVYNISDFDTMGASYSYYKNSDVNQFEYQQLTIWASRDLSADWLAKLTYNHKMSTSNVSNADGDVIGISLVYNVTNF